ncbi:dipeptidase [Bacillaceae bacterium IKA-2]|nr:dipeptidase [Bacillaceae bacterium IKA-2]
MKVIDTHCDVLLKLWRSPEKSRFSDSINLKSNFRRLQAGGVFIQCFAIFVPPQVKTEHKFQVALEQIDIFNNEILAKHPEMKQIISWDEIEQLRPNEIGAMITLEGADVFHNDLTKLRLLYKLGIKAMGLTWNNANLCADGVGERRGAGLTEFGKEVVHLNNDHQVWTDVSHLSENAFWDVMEIAEYPIASHSNSRSICDHPRNLTDQQAEILFKNGGFVSHLFYPPFVKENGVATIKDLIKHIDHFCSIGGLNHICFGSDFDGTETSLKKLKDASMYPNLINELLKHFKDDEVRGFAYQNFLNHRPTKRNSITLSEAK